MPLHWRGLYALELEQKAATILHSWASAFVRQAQADHSVLNPPPYLNSSVPGEFPRRRTGNLMLSIQQNPDTTFGIRSNGLRVAIGYTGAAPYFRPLYASGRLWILNSLTRLKWATGGETPRLGSIEGPQAAETPSATSTAVRQG